MLRPAVLSALALSSVLIACGGRLDGPVSSDEASPSPAPSPSPGAPAPMPMPERGGCTDATSNFARACLPEAARAGTTLRIAAEDDGCWSGCEGVSTTVSCKVVVEGRTVQLSLAVNTCTDGRDSFTCISACFRQRVECEIPPLPAGTYRIVTEAPPSPTMKALDGTLVVRDDATATSCLEIPQD